MSTLHTYLPQDRRRALSHGEILPDRTSGSALFADISGFTALTEALTQQLGQRRGIEELTRQVNAVYDALIAEIEKYDGSVIAFAGDAITCWFDGESALRAVTAALALQTAMTAFSKLGLKVAVTTGPARRFVVGDPAVQCLDALAGATIARLSAADHLAATGEVLIDAATAAALTDTVSLTGWCVADNGERFVRVKQLTAIPLQWAPEASFVLEAGTLRSWVLPAVFERDQSGHGTFLTELRPAVALFLRFVGIDYDDEQAGEKLDSLIVRVQAVLTRYEGALLQLNIGDKGSYLNAAFGAPTAHEDDVRRAVTAALELRTSIAEFDFLAPVQMGLSQGTVRAGAYGGSTRRTYGVLGDDVNLAARLMIAASPSEILVSQPVQRNASAEFSFKAYPPIRIKGKAEPIPVFAVTGKHRQRAIRLEEPVYALPMMGRQAELALIDEKLELTLRGQGQVIGITAEAGMGKSRLVAEVIRLAHQRGFTGYGGACESSGMNTPYLVWKPIWQAFFDVDPQMPASKAMRWLESEIEDRAPSRVPAIPVLSPVLDIPIEDNAFTGALEPKDRRNVLTAILEECLKSAAAEAPLLVVLEDLHWIDALSHDLLETLARVSAKLPVCFVLSYRPPETVRLLAPRVESLPFFTLVTLDKLTAAEAEQLIRAKLAQLLPARTGALPQALVAQLTARTEGNPFYIEELLNYLHDRGINPYETSALSALELPSSLHTLILSRIDRLSESEKVTLKTASIIGRLFSLAWLYGYYPALGEAEQVKADLAELARLALTPLDTPEPELVYLFKHIVTREVAYESLTYAMRAKLHEQLAQFIETQDADRYLDLLAFHYSLSENKAKQREYLQKAGDAAQSAFANDAALDYFTRLIPLLDDPYAQMELHLKRGTVLELTGQWSEAEADYRAALALGGQVADAAAVARCCRLLGVLFRLRGDYPSALSWLELARDAFTALDDRAGLAPTLIETGIVWWRRGEYASAHRETETGLAMARVSADKRAAASGLHTLGLVAEDQGDYLAARAYFEESLALERETGDMRGVSTSLNYLGIVANRQGDYVTSRALFEEGLAIRREIGDKQGIAASLNNLGIAANYQGDQTTARALHEQSLALKREIGEKWGIAASLINLGFVAQEQGEYVKARALFEESLALERELDNKRGVSISLNNLGNLAIEQGDAATAQAHYRECLALCKETGNQLYFVYSLSGLAAVMAHRDDLPRATRLVAAAETLRLSVGAVREKVESRIYARIVATSRAGLSEAAFNAAWAEGERMTLEEALDYVRLGKTFDPVLEASPQERTGH